MTQQFSYETRVKFGIRLEEAIRHKGLKKKEVAERIGVNPPCVCHYTYGLRVPSLGYMMRIAKVLELTDDEVKYICEPFTEEEW